MTGFEGWDEATPSQRVQMLQSLENQIAASQNRQPAKVTTQLMSSNRHGYFSRDRNTIVMNQEMVAYSLEPTMCVRNVTHEGRHALQWDAVKHPERHTEISKETLSQWKSNMENYKSYNRERVDRQVNRAAREMTPQQTARLRQKAHKKTFESYQNQAIEKDARSFASQFLSRLTQSQNQSQSQKQGQKQGRVQNAEPSRSQGQAQALGQATGHPGNAHSSPAGRGGVSSGKGLASAGHTGGPGLSGGHSAGFGSGGHGGVGAGVGAGGHGGHGGIGAGAGTGGHGGAGAGAGAGGGHGGSGGGSGGHGGGGGHGR